jgi:hypothetical protein
VNAPKQLCRKELEACPGKVNGDTGFLAESLHIENRSNPKHFDRPFATAGKPFAAGIRPWFFIWDLSPCKCAANPSST